MLNSLLIWFHFTPIISLYSITEGSEALTPPWDEDTGRWDIKETVSAMEVKAMPD